MAAKRALINRAIGVAIKGHAKVFKLVNHLRGVAAHELNGVLVAEIIGTLDRVIHMPQPTVFGHIAQRGADTTLGGHRVRTSRKYFR